MTKKTENEVQDDWEDDLQEVPDTEAIAAAEAKVDEDIDELSFTERTEKYCTEHRVGTKAARAALNKMDILEEIATITSAKQIGTVRAVLEKLVDMIF